MCARAVSLNTKIDPQEKEVFIETCESLGMTPSSAIKVFVRVFNEHGGFPFELRRGFPSTETAGTTPDQSVEPTARPEARGSSDAPRDRMRSAADLFAAQEEAAVARRAPVAARTAATSPTETRSAPMPDNPLRRRELSASQLAMNIPEIGGRDERTAVERPASTADASDTAVLNRQELDAVMASVYDSVPAQGGTSRNASAPQVTGGTRQNPSARAGERASAPSPAALRDLEEPYGNYDSNFEQLSHNEMQNPHIFERRAGRGRI